jgi:hypothetical protein
LGGEDAVHDGNVVGGDVRREGEDEDARLECVGLFGGVCRGGGLSGGSGGGGDEEAIDVWPGVSDAEEKQGKETDGRGLW